MTFILSLIGIMEEKQEVSKPAVSHFDRLRIKAGIYFFLFVGLPVFTYELIDNDVSFSLGKGVSWHLHSLAAIFGYLAYVFLIMMIVVIGNAVSKETTRSEDQANESKIVFCIIMILMFLSFAYINQGDPDIRDRRIGKNIKVTETVQNGVSIKNT